MNTYQEFKRLKNNWKKFEIIHYISNINILLFIPFFILFIFGWKSFQQKVMPSLYIIIPFFIMCAYIATSGVLYFVLKSDFGHINKLITKKNKLLLDFKNNKFNKRLINVILESSRLSSLDYIFNFVASQPKSPNPNLLFLENYFKNLSNPFIIFKFDNEEKVIKLENEYIKVEKGEDDIYKITFSKENILYYEFLNLIKGFDNIQLISTNDNILKELLAYKGFDISNLEIKDELEWQK